MTEPQHPLTPTPELVRPITPPPELVRSITPPPELVRQWLGEFFGCTVNGELSDSERFLTTRAAQWGADTELEACCEWLMYEQDRQGLRKSRRPKPLSLAEEALSHFESYAATFETSGGDSDLVRRALERLQELEGGNG